MSSTIRKRLDKCIDLLQLHAINPERYPFLLESVAEGPQGRFDILFAFPQQSIASPANFLDTFDQEFQKNKTNEVPDNDCPFMGGWFVFLSYEVVEEIEPTLQLPKSTETFPRAVAVRVPVAVIIDHQQQRMEIVAEAEFSHLIDDIESDLTKLNDAFVSPPAVSLGEIHEEAPDRYFSQLEKIHHYIVEGDVFQVNISRRWQLQCENTTAIDLYRRLREKNPAPFAGLMKWNGDHVISSSPERLVRIKNGKAETRPIAGTRPRRTATSADDSATLSELIGHPKERAEHVMLIDLERNDLGRVCKPGTIHVDELMVLESYAHVHHIVSNVSGELGDQVSPVDVIRAVFPGGTITGCPKVRCMEIIAELEQQGRGAYTGSFGYINRNGDMDLNILIRTMVKHEDTVSFRAGGGIVVDSLPGPELEETRAKARGLLKVFNDDLG